MNAEAAATSSDPSRSSHYVNDALYRELIANFTDWQDDARAVTDLAVRDEFRRLLEREARYLDQLRYDEWLKMYARGVHLLGAINTDGRRPAPRNLRHVRRPPPARRPHLPAAHRLRLVAGASLAHGAARHQRRSLRHRRRRRAHAALEFSDQRILGRRDARCSPAGPATASVREAGGWKIQAKQVNLIDCDQCIRNPSIIL